MSIRFYMDENVAGPIIDALRSRGVDVITVQEDSMVGAPDEKVLERATALNRVVFTFDRDFFAEATARQSAGLHFAGVVYARQLSQTIGQLVRDLQIIAVAGEPDDLADRIERLPL